MAVCCRRPVMNILELTRLGTHHVRNAVAEEIYLRTGRDATIPVSIYGEVIERCNYKCGYCDYWRRPNYRDEMSIEEWQKALLHLKDFAGHYHIGFSGGEAGSGARQKALPARKVFPATSLV